MLILTFKGQTANTGRTKKRGGGCHLRIHLTSTLICVFVNEQLTVHLKADHIYSYIVSLGGLIQSILLMSQSLFDMFFVLFLMKNVLQR